MSSVASLNKATTVGELVDFLASTMLLEEVKTLQVFVADGEPTIDVVGLQEHDDMLIISDRYQARSYNLSSKLMTVEMVYNHIKDMCREKPLKLIVGDNYYCGENDAIKMTIWQDRAIFTWTN